MSVHPHKKKEISGAHLAFAEDSAKDEMLTEKLRPRSSLKKSSLCWKAACWEEGLATVKMKERMGALGRWRSVYKRLLPQTITRWSDPVMVKSQESTPRPYSHTACETSDDGLCRGRENAQPGCIKLLVPSRTNQIPACCNAVPAQAVV